MPEESTLSPQEGLALIEDIIARTKAQYRNNSFYFMLWGWLISMASFFFFVLHHYTAFAYFFLPFPVLVIAGIVMSVIHFRRERRRQRTETYTDFFFSRLWMVLGIAFIVVVVVSLSQQLPPFLFALVIAGIGTLLSGMVLQFRPLIAGGGLFFVAAVAGIFIPNEYKPLLLGLAIMAGYLVPGYLLKARRNG
jgi:hypothetical protein